MQALWMVLGAFLFATMGVGIKFASADFNSFEIVFYRGLVGMAFLIVLTRVRGVSLRTQVPMMHVWRSVVGVTALSCWFYSIGELPLATSMTLNYMSSVWIAAFLLGGAVIVQNRQTPIRSQGPLFVAVISGFIGVAMMLRPSFTHEQLGGALAGLVSGIFSAFAYLQVAALAGIAGVRSAGSVLPPPKAAPPAALPVLLSPIALGGGALVAAPGDMVAGGVPMVPDCAAAGMPQARAVVISTAAGTVRKMRLDIGDGPFKSLNTDCSLPALRVTSRAQMLAL